MAGCRPNVDPPKGACETRPMRRVAAGAFGALCFVAGHVAGGVLGVPLAVGTAEAQPHQPAKKPAATPAPAKVPAPKTVASKPAKTAAERDAKAAKSKPAPSSGKAGRKPGTERAVADPEIRASIAGEDPREAPAN